MHSSVHVIDYVVLVCYLLLMAGIGAYFMRFMRVGADFLKGGNRVEWWVAGMASFMSGFSVWTFTGGAGFAYRQGVIGVFLMFLAVPAFLFGYVFFAQAWRRSRVSTVVEYIRSRFGEGTHKTFSWLTGPSQLMFGSVRLFALSSFMSIALGVPVEYLVIVCGIVVLAYTVLGGYWAVCFTDMFQFMFLFPIACVLMVLSLANVGGLSSFVAQAPAGYFNPFAGDYGWLFLIVYTVSQTTGYNNFGNAQRYFCADTEQSAKRIAVLCMILFTIGSLIFYLPPLIARVALPDLGTAANGLKQPSEAAYIAMGLRVLPPGMVGVLLAAMLASSMASLSAHNHIITGIFAKDLYQGYLRKDASDRHMLTASRLTSLGVGLVMICVALLFAQGATGIFTLLFILESMFLIPLGLPLLYGFVAKGGPWWSAVCAYVVGAITSLIVNLYLNRYLGMGLNETYLIGLPAITTTIAFFIPVLFISPEGVSRRVDSFFAKLKTPVDPATELGATGVSGRGQLALVGKVTTGMGIACFALVAASSPGRDRLIVGIYAVVTTLIGLAFIGAGRVPTESDKTRAQAIAAEPVSTDMQAFTNIRTLNFVLGTLLLVLVGASLALGSVRTIWAVNDGEKVERDDLNNPNKRANSAWDGRKIKIFGARNEVIAFQIIVEADQNGINKLAVTLPHLKSSKGKITYTAPGSDPTNYAGRPIQIFSVNYMNVEVPSHAEWVYKVGSPAAPKDPTGWKPVQLIPENARAGVGGFPLRVAGNQNQSVWIEIYTDRNLPAGIYSGTVTVDADGQKQAIPVELELFDFTLPDENSMHAMVYYESLQPKLYQGRDLDPEYHRFAHRQRIELVHAYDINSATAAAGRFDGTDFKKAKGYEGPGLGVGNQIIPRTFYGPGKTFDERENAWREADSWITFLGAKFPHAITFLYLPDEPGRSEYNYIRQLAENPHSNPGPGKALPTFVTKHYVKDLDGAIDIWDTGPLGYDIKRADEERQRGHKYWIYNGGRPAAGAIVIDAPATDPRATIWACFKHGIDNYFYWHGVHWQHNRQKVGERKQNVWVNPITFDNRGQPNKPIDDQGYINGDGVLIYPGEDKLHPEQDRGIAGPISTIQLANFRRGLQDHQYLTLARKLKLDAVVNDAVQSVVPRVFSDSGPAIGFSEAGNDYERARYQLAQAIAANEGE